MSIAAATTAAPARATSSAMGVRRSNLKRVTAAATAAGCEVTTATVSADYIWAVAWGREGEPRDIERAAAERTAARYVWVSFVSDANDGDVVAVASRKDGVTSFVTVDGREYDWTTARMDGLDWCRCDKCGTARARKTVYIVRRSNGTDEQLGGVCAKEAADRLRTQLAEFSALMAALAPWDEDMGGGGRVAFGDVPTMLAWAPASINLYGYVKSSGMGPTRDAVLSSVGRGNVNADFRAELARIDALALQAEAVAWLDEQDDSDFVRNCRGALDTGALRMAGFLAYIPEGVRRDKERKVAAAAAAEAFAYDPTTDDRAAKIASFTAADLRITDKHWAKLLAGNAPKAVLKKVDGCLSGVWTVLRVRVFEGWEFTTTFITFQRTDGARVTWAASGSHTEFAAGEAYRLRGSVEANVRKGKFGDERRIKRVTAIANLAALS